jgi:hypothetical protein
MRSAVNRPAVPPAIGEQTAMRCGGGPAVFVRPLLVVLSPRRTKTMRRLHNRDVSDVLQQALPAAALEGSASPALRPAAPKRAGQYFTEYEANVRAPGGRRGMKAHQPLSTLP